ncbi:hypothetical protein ACFFLS_00090 [Flavobacterium procerum]|uniref:DUF983 domain-containing protein n=1 Tax=Flavobacterium procerum TaxID=1455569 RepID=A0ABV6BJ27_9FLAO
MIENYSFNEPYKRFEPHETKCTYCGEAHMKTMQDCYFIPLFVTNDRTNIIVYSSVSYSKILIGIPRCSSCRNIHETSSSKAIWIGVGVAIAGIAFLVYNFMSLPPMVTIIGFFAVIFGAVFGSQKLTETFVANHDIYTKRDGAETNEVVRDLVLAGWSFKQPTA